MAANPAPRLTPEQYLEIERKAEFRSEYLNGVMWPVGGDMVGMAGATLAHTDIVCSLVRELGNQFRGTPCRPLAQDMRVRTSTGGLYCYPDVVVVCGEPVFADTQADTLLNPLVIAEVLSPSTEAFDRGEKFARYQQIESLREYLLVSQDRARVERFVRQDNGGGWLYTIISGLDSTVRLASADITLALADVYDRVELAPAVGDII